MELEINSATRRRSSSAKQDDKPQATRQTDVNCDKEGLKKGRAPAGTAHHRQHSFKPAVAYAVFGVGVFSGDRRQRLPDQGKLNSM